MSKYSVRVTKCYLVQVLDDEGNEVACDYVFSTKKEAEQTGKELVRVVNKNEDGIKEVE